jgi:hypothetical protein
MVNNCIPLILTNQYGNKYPGIWDKLENIYEMEKKRPFNKRKTNDRLIDIIKMYNKNYEHVADFWNWGNASQAYNILVDSNMFYLTQYLGAWRIHKQIYRFSKELEYLLYEQDDGLDTPIKILNNLPYDSIYIETNSLSYNNKTILGFFVSKIDNRTDLRGCINYHFCAVYEDLSTQCCSFRYSMASEDTSIYDAILNTVMKENFLYDTKTGRKLSKKELKEIAIKNIKYQFENGELQLLPKMMQLVFYICADNKEIIKNDEQSKIFDKPKNKQFIKDKFTEVQIWDCGNKISIRTFSIRNNHDSSTEAQIEKEFVTGKSKAPHSRRGHWHHYWVGKKDSEERRLILKWIAPTFVNGTPNTVNINIVENE